MSGGDTSGRLVAALAGGESATACRRWLQQVADLHARQVTGYGDALSCLSEPPTLLTVPPFGTTLGELTGPGPGASPDAVRDGAPVRRSAPSDRVRAHDAVSSSRTQTPSPARRHPRGEPTRPDAASRPDDVAHFSAPGDAGGGHPPPDAALAPHGLQIEHLQALAGSGKSEAGLVGAVRRPRRRTLPNRAAAVGPTPVRSAPFPSPAARPASAGKASESQERDRLLDRRWSDRVESRTGIRCHPSSLDTPLPAGLAASVQILERLTARPVEPTPERTDAGGDHPGGMPSGPPRQRRRRNETARGAAGPAHHLRSAPPSERVPAAPAPTERETGRLHATVDGGAFGPADPASEHPTPSAAEAPWSSERLPMGPDFEDQLQQVLTDAARRHGIEV